MNYLKLLPLLALFLVGCEDEGPATLVTLDIGEPTTMRIIMQEDCLVQLQ